MSEPTSFHARERREEIVDFRLVNTLGYFRSFPIMFAKTKKLRILLWQILYHILSWYSTEHKFVDNFIKYNA
jgi:hypothetical protein